MTRIIAILMLTLPSLARAEDNIRILPDQAVLACQARADHMLMERGADAEAVKRFVAEAMENFMFRVKGQFETKVAGEERRVDVTCDVSSNGVEVFTMVIEPMS